jgi:hypothetical protein
MKKIFWFIFFVPVILFAQIHEFGISAGGNALVTDLGTDAFYRPDGYYFSVLYRSNTNERISFKFELSRSVLTENDAKAESAGRRLRGWKTDLTLYDFSIMVEYHFLPLNPYKIPDNFMWTTPYLALGLGVYSSSFTIYPYPEEPFSHIENSLMIPLAFGLKFSFKNRFKIIWEISPRYAISDNLEGSKMADNLHEPLTDRRGSDWYIVNSISLNFGWGKLPCYLNTF